MIRKYTPINTKIVISGASGFIGSYLKRYLEQRAFEVYVLVRKPTTNQNEISWDPAKGYIDVQKLNTIAPDIIINLSGSSIVKGIRWNKKRKVDIYNSRIQSTALLAKTIDEENLPVKTFISTSAVGFYGSSNDEMFEDSHPGTDFLAQVSDMWEFASELGRDDVRVVNPRFGIVMDASGGFLKQMSIPIKLFVGATFGKGDNYISWISLHDLVRAIEFIIENKEIEGPVNMVTPRAISQKNLMREIARAYHRPLLFSIPAFVVRSVFGKEKAQTFFMANQKVVPEKLTNKGFEWDYVDISQLLTVQ